MGEIYTGLSGNYPWDFAVLDDYCYMVNGVDRDMRYDGEAAFFMSIRMNGTVPTFNSNIDGSLTAGTYYYRYTYYNINNQVESNPSDLSAAMTAAANPNDGIKINIPANTAIDGQVTHINIYRSQVGGTIVYYVGQTAWVVGGTTYSDTVADLSLGDALGEVDVTGTVQSFMYGEAPVCPYIESFAQRLWMGGNVPYSVNTVTVAADPTVVGATTVFVQGMKGMKFRVVGDNRHYIIASVTDATNLELTESYAGTVGAGKEYIIYGEGSILYYSYIDLNGNPKGWAFPSTYWLGVFKDDGDKISGLGICNNRLIITKYNHLYELTGTSPDNYDIAQISSTIGCVSNKTIAADEKGNLIFYSGRGVYITDGVSVSCISDKIETLFTNRGSPPWFVYASLNNISHGVYNPTTKRYYLWVTTSIAAGATPDVCLMADFNLIDEKGQPEWFPLAIDATASCITRDTNNINWVYTATINGWVLRQDYGTIDKQNPSDAGTVAGTVTSYVSDYVLRDNTAAFYTGGNGLMDMYISFFNSNGSFYASALIASNNATDLTFTTTVSSAYAGKTYELGPIRAYRKTKWFTLDSMNDKITKWFKMIFNKQSTAFNIYIKRYKNLQWTPVEETLYSDQSQSEGYVKKTFTTNKARSHQVEIGRDGHKPFYIDEMEINIEELNR